MSVSEGIETKGSPPEAASLDQQAIRHQGGERELGDESSPVVDSGINPPPARLFHRLAVLLICLVWPLIWVGGLVTTYDAGMAVPDWPGTYGYNLFLYPYKTWLFGPFDLFIEHGHRLLGAIVGLVAIGCVVAAYKLEPRRWVFGLSLGILAAVIFQGSLGGMRVVLADRTLAMVHGCVGPAFFALCVVAAVVSGRRWWQRRPVQSGSAVQSETTVPSGTAARGGPILKKPGAALLGLSILLLATAYAQLVLGAQLRHVQPTTPPSQFTLVVALHVVTAFLFWAASAVLWVGIRRCGDLTLSRPAAALIGLLGVQISLGIGTWVVNYGWPDFLQWFPGSTGFLLNAKGFVDSIVVTAHVATGSLILAVCVVIVLRITRVRHWMESLSRRSDHSIDDEALSRSTPAVS